MTKGGSVGEGQAVALITHWDEDVLWGVRRLGGLGFGRGVVAWFMDGKDRISWVLIG